MKKLVPFKKDINFDTNVAEINSISLEHEISVQENHLITGKFVIAGDYKMTDASVNLDTFEYELPFNINVDKKYQIDNALVEISDFYYEVINNKILSVNIELSISNIEEIEEETMRNETILDELNEPELTEIEEETQNLPKQELTEQRNDTVTEKVKSLFDGLDENDNYVTYKIHIVTENDTIESIITDYEVTQEDLNQYNDLSEIKVGDKIIVPANEN